MEIAGASIEGGKSGIFRADVDSAVVVFGQATYALRGKRSGSQARSVAVDAEAVALEEVDTAIHGAYPGIAVAVGIEGVDGGVGEVGLAVVGLLQFDLVAGNHVDDVKTVLRAEPYLVVDAYHGTGEDAGAFLDGDRGDVAGSHRVVVEMTRRGAQCKVAVESLAYEQDSLVVGRIEAGHTAEVVGVAVVGVKPVASSADVDVVVLVDEERYRLIVFIADFVADDGIVVHAIVVVVTEYALIGDEHPHVATPVGDDILHPVVGADAVGRLCAEESERIVKRIVDVDTAVGAHP